MNERTEKKTSRFWIAHGLLPLVLFFALVAVFEATDLDRILSAPFFDAATGAWPFRESWWAKDLIHEVGRRLILVIALSALAAWALSCRIERLRRFRRAALFLALSIGLGTGLVALGKATLNRHCPWDCDCFGGPVPYVKLFEPTPPGFGKGNCFPAGHASGGFSLMSGYFIFSGRSRRRAVAALLIGIGVGAVFGFGQVARGAHFVSHNLWTAAVCWFSALALYRWGFRGRLSVASSGREKG